MYLLFSQLESRSTNLFHFPVNAKTKNLLSMTKRSSVRASWKSGGIFTRSASTEGRRPHVLGARRYRIRRGGT